MTVLCLGLPTYAAAATPAPGPALPLSHAGRWLTDASGRVIMMHGTNVVYKLAPYYPAVSGFGDSDAAFLRSIGFSVVRVGVIWKGLEPQPGVYDEKYLNQIAGTVQMLARHGIVSLLDFHQDMYNEKFQGEGFPDWAVQDGGLPTTQLGFPQNYFVSPGLQRAFENFWSDMPGPGGIGLQERYASAWRHVAGRFRGDRSVLGYEIMNEPFPGSDYLSCGAPTGCPASDAQLTGLEHKVDRAIRSVDARTLVFYEPYVTFNFGYQDHVGPLDDPRAVFAWHNYCLAPPESAGCSSHADTMANADAHVAQTGEGTFMTEYGATTGMTDLDQMVSLADKHMVPWTEWAYCTCQDPTGASDEGIVNDPTRPKSGANLVAPTLDSIVEPYPQVTAGTPRSWSFDRSNKAFQFSYTTARASGKGSFRAGSVTEIAVPPYVFRNGYSAHVAGGAIVSRRGASVLRIASCPRARSVTVTLAPGGRSSQTCRPHLRIRVRPKHVRLGRLTAYRFTVTAVLGVYSAPVAGARVSLAGRTARSGRRGHAKLVVTLSDPARSYRATARAAGYKTGRIRLMR